MLAQIERGYEIFVLIVTIERNMKRLRLYCVFALWAYIWFLIRIDMPS